MLEIKVHNEIANDAMSGWFIGGNAFSLAEIQRLIEENPEENEIKLNIHCVGGDVNEGLAIYDYLRTSGKTIYTNIEGMCHSMAIVLLLSAPKENRSANVNATALIHQVQGGAFGNIDFVEATLQELKESQERIKNIYEDRTDLTREEIDNLFDEEKEHGMDELYEWGFITKINSYNTNKKTMVKNRKSLKQRTLNLLKKLNKGVNYEHFDADGNLLFTTEAEDERLEIGMVASPDGEFTLANGERVKIEEGKIVEIEAHTIDEDFETIVAENEELKAEVETLKAENEQLKTDLEEAKKLLEEYADATESKYEPKNRKNMIKSNSMSSEERKNILRNLKK